MTDRKNTYSFFNYSARLWLQHDLMSDDEVIFNLFVIIYHQKGTEDYCQHCIIKWSNLRTNIVQVHIIHILIFMFSRQMLGFKEKRAHTCEESCLPHTRERFRKPYPIQTNKTWTRVPNAFHVFYRAPLMWCMQKGNWIRWFPRSRRKRIRGNGEYNKFS